MGIYRLWHCQSAFLFTVNPVVARGGFFYGSLHFLSMMVFLFLFFFATGHGKGEFKGSALPVSSQTSEEL